MPSGAAVHADATVTFAARKPGLCFEPGRGLAGEVILADIGIDIGIDVGAPVGGATLGYPEAADVAAWLTPPGAETHKWHSGLLVVGGSGGMTGAPMLVSHAAMRVGAGIVWCGVPGKDAAAAAVGRRGHHQGAARDRRWRVDRSG